MGLSLFLILSAQWVFGGAWWSWRHHKDYDFADIAMLFYSLYLVIGFPVVGLVMLLLMKVWEWLG